MNKVTRVTETEERRSDPHRSPSSAADREQSVIATDIPVDLPTIDPKLPTPTPGAACPSEFNSVEVSTGELLARIVGMGKTGKPVRTQLVVIGNVEGYQEQILIDTGSEQDLICWSRLSHHPGLQELIAINMRPTSIRITGAGGHQSMCDGELEVTTDIGGRRFEMTAVLIENCPYSIIIGMPTLTRLGMSVSLASGLLTLAGGRAVQVLSCGAGHRGPEMWYPREVDDESTRTMRAREKMMRQLGKEDTCEVGRHTPTAGSLRPGQRAPVRAGSAPCESLIQPGPAGRRPVEESTNRPPAPTGLSAPHVEGGSQPTRNGMSAGELDLYTRQNGVTGPESRGPAQRAQDVWSGDATTGCAQERDRYSAGTADRDLRRRTAQELVYGRDLNADPKTQDVVVHPEMERRRQWTTPPTTAETLEEQSPPAMRRRTTSQRKARPARRRILIQELMEAAREANYYEVLDAGVTLQEAADELLEEAASGLHSGDAPKEPIPMGVNDGSGGTKASAEEGREWKRRARVINDRPNEQRTRKRAKWRQRRDLYERQARVDKAPKAAQRASGEGPVEEGEIEPRSRRKRR